MASEDPKMSKQDSVGKRKHVALFHISSENDNNKKV
jgi:hypothetical protein